MILLRAPRGGCARFRPHRRDPPAALRVSLTGDECKLVFSRLGDRLRIAGACEPNGYDTALNDGRCRAPSCAA